MKTCDIKVKKKYTSYLKILFKYNENICVLCYFPPLLIVTVVRQ